MGFRRRSAAFGVAVVAAACVAFACGATVAEEAATPDASAVDGPSGDGAPVDAPADDGAVADGGDAASARFCTSLPDAHDFCEDFQEPLYFGTAHWTRPVVANAGRLRVVNGELVSEIIEHDSGNANNPAALLLERDWSLPDASAKRLSFSYRSKIELCNAVLPLSILGGVDRPPGYIYNAYVEITQAVDCTAKAVSVVLDTDGGAPAYFFGAPIPIAAGSFVDYAITLEENNGTTTMVLTARGMTSTATFPAAARGDVITLMVGAGRPWVYGAPETLVFDDILFDDGR